MIYPENLQSTLTDFGKLKVLLMNLQTTVQLTPCNDDRPNHPSLEHLHKAMIALQTAELEFCKMHLVNHPGGEFAAPPIWTHDDQAAMDEARANLDGVDVPPQLRDGNVIKGSFGKPAGKGKGGPNRPKGKK